MDAASDLSKANGASSNSVSTRQLLEMPLQWRHNETGNVSKHQPHDCLLNRLFNVQIKENIKAPCH